MLAKGAPSRDTCPMSSIDTCAGRIGIAVAGRELDATPILFLHGVGSDKSVWAPQLEHFGASRPAVAIDYPGYGESDAKPNSTRDDFAKAALAALDAQEIERAHICGLSLGGVVALALNALSPDRCASLILADSFAVHPDGAAIFKRSADASRASPMRALAEARAPALLGEAARGDAALVAQVIETMAAIDPAAYRQGAEAVWLANQRERVAAVAVPTLVIVGSEDSITPPALSRDLADMIRGARLVEIAGAGHLTNIEAPAAFNRAVAGFLNEIDVYSNGYRPLNLTP